MLLVSVAPVKAQVLIEMVNTTGNTINNLLVNGTAYGAMAPHESKTVKLTTVQTVDGVPYFNFFVKIGGMDFSARKESMGMAYAYQANSGTFKVGIILTPGQHADVQLLNPKANGWCGSKY